MDPADLPGARFAWFSPGCTHHSPANAKKLYQRGRQRTIFDGEDDFDEVAYANSERSRVTMSCVLRYAEKHKPEILVVENVVEVTLWGPGRDGPTFAWWKRTLEKISYEIQCLFFQLPILPSMPAIASTSLGPERAIDDQTSITDHRIDVNGSIATAGPCRLSRAVS